MKSSARQMSSLASLLLSEVFIAQQLARSTWISSLPRLPQNVEPPPTIQAFGEHEDEDFKPWNWSVQGFISQRTSMPLLSMGARGFSFQSEDVARPDRWALPRQGGVHCGFFRVFR